MMNNPGSENAFALPQQSGDLTGQLISRLKDLIGQGILRPGDRIPPERELARMFGVSRSSLREALRVLDIMGILEQRVGHGSRLTSHATSILSEPMDFLVCLEGIDFEELMEARFMVEPELAAKAAERATGEDIRAMETTIELMGAHGSDLAKAVEQDIAFHRAVHRAARNRICESMFASIHRSLGSIISVATQMVDVPHTLKFHRAICKAIRERDPEEARKKMAEHLVDVRALLAKAEDAVRAEGVQQKLVPIRGRRGEKPAGEGEEAGTAE